MSVLLIPTRNRPNSLGAVLAFIAEFFPGRKIVISDGSREEYHDANQTAINASGSVLSIDYRQFDPDLPFFDRLLNTLQDLDDDTVIMGADDDYPQFDVLDKAETVMRKNPEIVTALGATIHLKILNEKTMLARFDHAHPVRAKVPNRRALHFAQWPYSTTYAVTRREHLIERYMRAKKLFLAGFYDYITGVHDAMAGGIGVVPGVSYISTHNYSHSYLRPEEPLIFLRRADEVLRVYEQFIEDLKRFDAIDVNVAVQVATRLIKSRVATLSGVPPQKRNGFDTSPVRQNQLVCKQLDIFRAIFEASNDVRLQMEPRLLFIRDRLLQVVRSPDNQGEKKYYETLESQISDNGKPSKKDTPVALLQGTTSVTLVESDKHKPEVPKTIRDSDFLYSLDIPTMTRTSS